MKVADLFLTERFTDRLALLQRWRDDSDIYVSFTALPKIGINPRSPWDTPIGVYAYPLREMYENIAANRIPYAGEAPYIQVLRSNKITELSQYNDADLARDINKLRDKYIEELCDCLWDMRRHLRNPDFDDVKTAAENAISASDSSQGDAYDRAFDIAMHTWSEEALHKDYPASKLWNITRWMANMLVNDRKKKQIDSPIAPAKSVMWNALLRSLGYEGFSDKNGIGIIHENEPVSAVFLTGVAFTHVETIRNVIKSDRSRLR
jgi:hypothetical protein